MYMYKLYIFFDGNFFGNVKSIFKVLIFHVLNLVWEFFIHQNDRILKIKFLYKKSCFFKNTKLNVTINVTS